MLFAGKNMKNNNLEGETDNTKQAQIEQTYEKH